MAQELNIGKQCSVLLFPIAEVLYSIGIDKIIKNTINLCTVRKSVSVETVCLFSMSLNLFFPDN